MRIQTAILLLPFLILFFGCTKRHEYKEVKQYTIEQFMNTERIGGASFSPDEQSVLYSSNRSGIFNAYAVPVTGADAEQITDSKDNSIFSISYFPNDTRILYTSDQGGNEINHIYVQNEDGTVQDLTPEPKAKAAFMGWSHDEKSFFFGSNKRTLKFFDTYEMDAETFKATMIYQNDEGMNVQAISPDKRFLALTKTITTSNSEMYLHDRETGTTTHLSPHEGDVQFEPQTFSLDSKVLYYLTDEGSEFLHLVEYDLDSGAKSTVYQSDWDVVFADLSRGGSYRVVGINNDGKTEIIVTDLKTGEPVSLPEFPNAEIVGVRFSKSERRMAFYANGSRSPSNLFVYDFDTESFKQLTNSMNPDISQDDLVEAEVIRYQSFDGVEIPAIYYRPHQIKPGETAPALVWVHGGPGGQSRVGYSPLIQYLVNHGYVVLAVNNRGSSGYGKTFYKMDDLKHGQDDLDDCVWAKKFLAGTGVVDTAKIGIIGGSYGGYMVCAAMTFRPTEFAVGVDIFGVTNWVRTLKSIPPWWEAFREALYKELGDPFKDEEMLRAKSPLFHAENIVRPMIVLQGANDPRVLQVESDEMVAAARKNGVPVEYIVFPDEGHGFVKKENEIKGYKAILQFLEQYLKQTPAG